MLSFYGLNQYHWTHVPVEQNIGSHENRVDVETERNVFHGGGFLFKLR